LILGHIFKFNIGSITASQINGNNRKAE